MLNYLHGTMLCLALVVAMPATAAEYANGHLLISADALAARAEGSPALGDVRYGGDTIVIDVRTEKDFVGGHIPGALRLDPDAVSDPNAPIAGALRTETELVTMLGMLGVTAKTHVILYDDKGGFHAARMFWLLEYLGHRRVSLLDGGLRAWREGGHRVETGRVRTSVVVANMGKFTPAVAARRYASADWILEHRADPKAVVIDVRPGTAFAKGHIPWAKNIPWKLNLDANERMKSPAALRAHFESHGVTPAHSIVVHCQNGKASAHSYFALRLLGYPRVRTYHRSWSEWGLADDLPKAMAKAG